MGDYKQDGRARFSGGRGGGFSRRDGDRSDSPRKSWGGSDGRDRGPVTMHQAICDQCKKPCEVPFRPIEGKPVYCNTCFGIKKESENRGSDRFPKKDFNTYRAPVKTDIESNISKGSNDELKQLEMLNVKMDRLIKAVEVMANIKPLVIAEKTKKTVPVVKVKKLVKKSK